MANIFDGFFKQIATGDSVKDYKHASRLFVDNNYARSPKYNWLYHVFFDVDPEISNLDNKLVMSCLGVNLGKFCSFSAKVPWLLSKYFSNSFKKS